MLRRIPAKKNITREQYNVPIIRDEGTSTVNARVSVIIPTKNAGKDFRYSMEKISRQKGVKEVEIIIVDSGSTDRTLDIVKKYDVKIMNILPEQFTYGFSLNHGIGESSGEIVCSLSAHCIPAGEQWLSELIRPITDGTAHATYGRQVPVKGVNPFEEVSLSKHFPENEKKTGRVPFSNANCAFMKKMWEKLKFDKTLSSWEDYLWYIFLKDTYIFKYCPEAAVYHTHPFSIRTSVKHTYNDGKAFRILKDKYGIDVLNDTCPGIMSKIKIISGDLINHVTFFCRKGYKKHILLIPVVRLYAYFVYWKGYKSVG